MKNPIRDTKPNAEIMKALAEGRKIKCKVWDSSKSAVNIASVNGIIIDKEGYVYYVTGKGWHYKHAEPIKTKTIVKDIHELVTLFIEKGYVINKYGNFDHPGAVDSFTADMWEFCGKEPSDWFAWDKSWLKKVPVEDEK